MLRFHFFTAKQGTWVHKDDRGPYIVWLRITDEGSVPEMRIWSISLKFNPIKNGVYILVEVSIWI